MNKTSPRYYSYRIRLEKLKQKTWVLVIVARALLFLVTLGTYYLGRS
jgi:hypothetical protein